MEAFGITPLLDQIFSTAISLRASDIHLEPREEFLQVRYRVDGLLSDGEQIPKTKQGALLSRVKVLVSLDIAETRVPQDGRCEIKSSQKNFDLRVSTIPTVYGEKAVLRMLNREHLKLKLEELGMDLIDLRTYRSIIRKKTGIVLVTGPTGSGKTTTLYATLAELNSREVNIITVEDPVEYQLPGINQIQINNKSGLTFARGLRSILRQDPDIIMVGEIRDLETARIAVQAALTGHLVFSTLHTNDAPSAVVRLQEMGIEKYLIEATVLGVVAQRLVRKISADGYQGQTGLYEIMDGTAPGKNTRTLRESGLAKVSQGITSQNELARVLSLEG